MKSKNKLTKSDNCSKFLIILSVIVFVGAFFMIIDNIIGPIFVRVNVLKETSFSDFAQTMRFCLSDNPYKDTVLKTSYPPLAFMLVYPFALISKNIDVQNYNDMKYHYQFWISYTLFFAIFAALFIILVIKFANFHGKRAVVSAALFLFSAPFLYLMLRGNVIILSAVFLMLFLCGFNSKKRWIRELSLVALAFAGVIKIYTLIFSVLLMRKGRMLDCLKILIYFLLLFIVPFAFYEAGTFKVFLLNMKNFISRTGQNIYLDNASFQNIINMILNKVLGINLSSVAVKISQLILVIAILISGLFAALFIEEEKYLFILLIGLMFAIPNPAYFYMAIFYWITFAISLKSQRFSLIEKVFYIIIFLTLLQNRFTGVFIQSFAITIITIMLIVKGFKEGVAQFKNGRAKKTLKNLLSGFVTNGKSE